MSETTSCGYCKKETPEIDIIYGICRYCSYNSKQLQRDMIKDKYYGVIDPIWKRIYLYEHKGNKCWNCGYDKDIKALVFVNKDTFKTICISDKLCKRMDKLLDMIEDYRLYCKNCYSILS